MGFTLDVKRLDECKIKEGANLLTRERNCCGGPFFPASPNEAGARIIPCLDLRKGILEGLLLVSPPAYHALFGSFDNLDYVPNNVTNS